MLAQTDEVDRALPDTLRSVSAFSPRPAPRLPWHLLGTAVVAALVVLAGLADLHLHGESPAGEALGHLGADPEQGETVFLGASHPAEAPHAESAGTETHFRCPVCALHLQAADEARGDALVGRVLPSSILGGRAERARVSTPLLQPGGPRGPPLR